MTHYEQTNFKNIEKIIIKKYANRYLTRNENDETILYCKRPHICDIARWELHRGKLSSYKGIGILQERGDKYTYEMKDREKDIRPHIFFKKK